MGGKGISKRWGWFYRDCNSNGRRVTRKGDKRRAGRENEEEENVELRGGAGIEKRLGSFQVFSPFKRHYTG